MEDPDFYRRTCTKDGVELDDLKDDEIEIFEATSTDLGEEEHPPEPESSEIDCKAISDELEAMKRRILLLQLKLKGKVGDSVSDDECVDLELELRCSRNKDICTLQKNHYRLQCQINELLRCCKVAKEQIEQIRIRMCQQFRQMTEMEKKIARLESWRLSLDHEFGVCLERYEYLKHVKAEWKDVEKKLDRQNQCFAKMEERLVSKVCFKDEKIKIIDQLDVLRADLEQFFQIYSKKVKRIENCLYKGLNAQTLEKMLGTFNECMNESQCETCEETGDTHTQEKVETDPKAEAK